MTPIQYAGQYIIHLQSGRNLLSGVAQRFAVATLQRWRSADRCT